MWQDGSGSDRSDDDRDDDRDRDRSKEKDTAEQRKKQEQDAKAKQERSAALLLSALLALRQPALLVRPIPLHCWSACPLRSEKADRESAEKARAEREKRNAAQASSSTYVMDILDELKTLVEDLESVWRHMSLCFPADYGIVALYDSRYKKLVRVVINFHCTDTAKLTKAALLKFVNWITWYGHDHDHDHDLFASSCLHTELSACLCRAPRQVHGEPAHHLPVSASACSCKWLIHLCLLPCSPAAA